jgi:HEAT repeat protein
MKIDRSMIALILIISVQLGCSEGPFWRTGRLSPWAREKWQAEEQIADTLFERKRQLNELVSTARSADMNTRQQAASRLHEIVLRDQVLLMRLYAVQLLGQIDCPESVAALRDASKDPDPDVRIAAVKSWQKQPADTAINELQEIIASDTHIDVRVAATTALGQFSGTRAIRALSYALTDSNPALQVRATESLAQVTGENIGADVARWQDYIEKIGAGNSTQSERVTNRSDAGASFR